jgi:hypothetical protein
MKDQAAAKVIADAICKVDRSALPVEIVESYALAAALEYPIASEKVLWQRIVSAAKTAGLADPDLSGWLASTGLFLQGFPIRDAAGAVEKLHARVMGVARGRAFPLPVQLPRPDLPFGEESKRRRLGTSAEFDDTPCGRAAQAFLDAGSFSGLGTTSQLKLAVAQCEAASPSYSGRCAAAARSAFAEAFIASLVRTGGVEPDRPISGPLESRTDRINDANLAARAAAEFAFFLCNVPGFLTTAVGIGRLTGGANPDG